MSHNPVTIVKDGQLIITDEDNLLVEDVVIIQAGDLVPADIQLLEVNNLAADEFYLTGEIMPVIKKAGEPDNRLYMGSRITKGTGKGIVIATGEQTEFGRVLKQNWEQYQSQRLHFFEKKFLGPILFLLPAFLILLIQGINALILMAVFCAASFALIVLQNNRFVTDRLIAAERKRMERKNVVVRDPMALRWMCSVDMICFDKTGVLTTSYLQVKDLYLADKKTDGHHPRERERASPLIDLGCALCNEVLFLEKIDLANPIDKAIIAYAQKNGIDLITLREQYKRVFEQPFDSENRYMAVGFERKDHNIFCFVKGDPAVVVKFCTHYLAPNGDLCRTDFGFLSTNNENIERINQNGNSVIALAYSPELAGQPPSNLTFLCLLELENSLQPGAHDLVLRLSEKNIRSILLTGDRPETAGRVAMEAEITHSSRIYLTGPTIQYMAMNEVARQSGYCSVFARLMPSQKATLINMFQQNGHYIAMIGDGPNDGLALRTANIGISFMRNSSPIARRLSKILINDLMDVFALIDASERLNLLIGNVNVFRMLAIALLFMAAYGWVLTIYIR